MQKKKRASIAARPAGDVAVGPTGSNAGKNSSETRSWLRLKGGGGGATANEG